MSVLSLSEIVDGAQRRPKLVKLQRGHQGQRAEPMGSVFRPRCRICMHRRLCPGTPTPPKMPKRHI